MKTNEKHQNLLHFLFGKIFVAANSGTKLISHRKYNQSLIEMIRIANSRSSQNYVAQQDLQELDSHEPRYIGLGFIEINTQTTPLLNKYL